MPGLGGELPEETTSRGRNGRPRGRGRRGKTGPAAPVPGAEVGGVEGGDGTAVTGEAGGGGTMEGEATGAAAGDDEAGGGTAVTGGEGGGGTTVSTLSRVGAAEEDGAAVSARAAAAAPLRKLRRSPRTARQRRITNRSVSFAFSRSFLVFQFINTAVFDLRCIRSCCVALLAPYYTALLRSAPSRRGTSTLPMRPVFITLSSFIAFPGCSAVQRPANFRSPGARL